ncbi:hypothetical protein F5887DRAFT_1011183 [Amanita rubescens]|nr:hypothetical protein F5887DRAFT_1011183 [Amanita rubescens]
MSTPKWPSLYNLGIEVIDIPHNAPVQPRGAYLNHPIDVFRFTLFWTLIFYCPVFILCGCYAFWNLNFPPAPRPHNVRSTPESRQPHKRGREEEFWPPGTSSATDAYPLSPLKLAPSKPEPPPPPPLKPPTNLPSTSSSFPTAETFRSTTPFLPRTQAATTSASPHGPPVQSPPTPHTQKSKYNYKEHERRSRFTFSILLLLLFFAAGLAGAVLGSVIVGFVAATFFRSVDYNMSTWIPFLLALLMVLTGYLSLWPSIIDII